jgi:hypothetical protein
MIVINNYLPTMMTGSESNYIEHLDKLSALIEKYKDTHNIVIAGDLNGSLSSLSVTISSIVSGFCPDPVLFPFESCLAVFHWRSVLSK